MKLMKTGTIPAQVGSFVVISAAFALSGCNEPIVEPVEREQPDETTVEAPNAASEAAYEAANEGVSLAQQLASGTLGSEEASSALDTLERFASSGSFVLSESDRTKLSDSIVSARSALQAGDDEKLRESATAIMLTLDKAGQSVP